MCKGSKPARLIKKDRLESFPRGDFGRHAAVLS
jgi:hypothetical protein